MSAPSIFSSPSGITHEVSFMMPDADDDVGPSSDAAGFSFGTGSAPPPPDLQDFTFWKAAPGAMPRPPPAVPFQQRQRRRSSLWSSMASINLMKRRKSSVASPIKAPVRGGGSVTRRSSPPSSPASPAAAPAGADFPPQVQVFRLRTLMHVLVSLADPTVRGVPAPVPAPRPHILDCVTGGVVLFPVVTWRGDTVDEATAVRWIEIAGEEDAASLMDVEGVTFDESMTPLAGDKKKQLPMPAKTAKPKKAATAAAGSTFKVMTGTESSGLSGPEAEAQAARDKKQLEHIVDAETAHERQGAVVSAALADKAPASKYWGLLGGPRNGASFSHNPRLLSDVGQWVATALKLPWVRYLLRSHFLFALVGSVYYDAVVRLKPEDDPTEETISQQLFTDTLDEAIDNALEDLAQQQGGHDVGAVSTEGSVMSHRQRQLKAKEVAARREQRVRERRASMAKSDAGGGGDGDEAPEVYVGRGVSGLDEKGKRRIPVAASESWAAMSAFVADTVEFAVADAIRWDKERLERAASIKERLLKQRQTAIDKAIFFAKLSPALKRLIDLTERTETLKRKGLLIRAYTDFDRMLRQYGSLVVHAKRITAQTSFRELRAAPRYVKILPFGLSMDDMVDELAGDDLADGVAGVPDDEVEAPDGDGAAVAARGSPQQGSAALASPGSKRVVSFIDGPPLEPSTVTAPASPTSPQSPSRVKRSPSAATRTPGQQVVANADMAARKQANRDRFQRAAKRQSVASMLWASAVQDDEGEADELNLSTSQSPRYAALSPGSRGGPRGGVRTPSSAASPGPQPLVAPPVPSPNRRPSSSVRRRSPSIRALPASPTHDASLVGWVLPGDGGGPHLDVDDGGLLMGASLNSLGHREHSYLPAPTDGQRFSRSSSAAHDGPSPLVKGVLRAVAEGAERKRNAAPPSAEVAPMSVTQSHRGGSRARPAPLTALGGPAVAVSSSTVSFGGDSAVDSSPSLTFGFRSRSLSVAPTNSASPAGGANSGLHQSPGTDPVSRLAQSVNGPRGRAGTTTHVAAASVDPTLFTYTNGVLPDNWTCATSPAARSFRQRKPSPQHRRGGRHHGGTAAGRAVEGSSTAAAPKSAPTWVDVLVALFMEKRADVEMEKARRKPRPFGVPPGHVAVKPATTCVVVARGGHQPSNLREDAKLSMGKLKKVKSVKPMPLGPVFTQKLAPRPPRVAKPPPVAKPEVRPATASTPFDGNPIATDFYDVEAVGATSPSDTVRTSVVEEWTYPKAGRAVARDTPDNGVDDDDGIEWKLLPARKSTCSDGDPLKAANSRPDDMGESSPMPPLVIPGDDSNPSAPMTTTAQTGRSAVFFESSSFAASQQSPSAFFFGMPLPNFEQGNNDDPAAASITPSAVMKGAMSMATAPKSATAAASGSRSVRNRRQSLMVRSRQLKAAAAAVAAAKAMEKQAAEMRAKFRRPTPELREAVELAGIDLAAHVGLPLADVVAGERGFKIEKNGALVPSADASAKQRAEKAAKEAAEAAEMARVRRERHKKAEAERERRVAKATTAAAQVELAKAKHEGVVLVPHNTSTLAGFVGSAQDPAHPHAGVQQMLSSLASVVEPTPAGKARRPTSPRPPSPKLTKVRDPSGTIRHVFSGDRPSARRPASLSSRPGSSSARPPSAPSWSAPAQSIPPRSKWKPADDEEEQRRREDDANRRFETHQVSATVEAAAKRAYATVATIDAKARKEAEARRLAAAAEESAYMEAEGMVEPKPAVPGAPHTARKSVVQPPPPSAVPPIPRRPASSRPRESFDPRHASRELKNMAARQSAQIRPAPLEEALAAEPTHTRILV